MRAPKIVNIQAPVYDHAPGLLAFVYALADRVHLSSCLMVPPQQHLTAL